MKKLFLIAATLLCVSAYGSAEVNRTRTTNEECKYQYGENYHAEPSTKSEAHGIIRYSNNSANENIGAHNEYSGKANAAAQTIVKTISGGINGEITRKGEQNNSRNGETSETENYYKCVKDE